MQLFALFPLPKMWIVDYQLFFLVSKINKPWKKSILHPIFGGGRREQSCPLWKGKAITHFFSKTGILKKVYNKGRNCGYIRIT
jgi:hypothetical protein